MTRRQELHQQMEWINASRKRAGLSELELMIWSPGDGWTRYQLMDAEGHNRSYVCNLREMIAALQVAREMLNDVNYQRYGE